MATLSRRAFLVGSAVFAALMRRGEAASGRTRLVLLATAGGPRARKERGATANAVAIGDALYVVDCGNGVARQLAQADLPLTNLRQSSPDGSS